MDSMFAGDASSMDSETQAVRIPIPAESNEDVADALVRAEEDKDKEVGKSL